MSSVRQQRIWDAEKYLPLAHTAWPFYSIRIWRLHSAGYEL